MSDDLQSFGRLVARHYPAVAAVAFAITRDHALTEDIAQDTFVAAWGQRERLRDPEKVRAWLCGIARNQSKNALRARRREVQETMDREDTRPSVIDRAVDREQEQALRDALDKIAPAYREPLVLFYWEDQSIAEVARALAISEQAAQKRISRAREQLHGELVMRLDAHGRRYRQASASAAAAVLAVLATRSGVAAAASSSKGTFAFMSSTLAKILLLVGAAVVIVAGIAVWRGQSTTATPQRETADTTATATAAGTSARSVTAKAPAASPSLATPRDGAPRDAPAQPRGGLPTPPGYELTDLTLGNVSVNLAGGRSTTYIPNPTPPTVVRRLRGRVVDGAGKPVAGAVVIASEQLVSMMFMSFSGRGGAVSDAAGRFDLAYHDDQAGVALALHGRGWSTPRAVPAGRDDAELELVVPEPGAIRVGVRRGDEPRQTDVQLAWAGEPILVTVETDDDGRALMARLPPGRYSVSTSGTTMFDGGTAKSVSKTVEVVAGKTIDVVLDLPTGTIVSVTAATTQKFEIVTYYLVEGTAAALGHDELTQRLKSKQAIMQLVGGKDVDRTLQFFDVVPGAHTICVEAAIEYDDPLTPVCRTITVTEQPLVEVVIPIP